MDWAGAEFGRGLGDNLNLQYITGTVQIFLSAFSYLLQHPTTSRVRDDDGFIPPASQSKTPSHGKGSVGVYIRPSFRPITENPGMAL